MQPYTLQGDEFIIENYDEQKPFASFLPGVAGLDGIPMWVYYTNRGQGIACFGTENKDGSILDFVPANIAYRRTELQGYRTFVKVDGRVSELFSSSSRDQYKRQMIIHANGVGFEEINQTLGIKVSVNYYTTSHKPFAGLIRKVVIDNIDPVPKNIEVLDGLMTLWPFKNDNFVIKNMANLAVAWFDVFNVENNMPFYRNRSTTSDSAAVGSVEAGHFYAAFASTEQGALPIVYDPDLIFGNHTGLLKAVNFEKTPLCDLLKHKQVAANKLPCAFAAFDGVLETQVVMTSIAGMMSHLNQLIDYSKDFSVDYFLEQERAAYDLADHLTQDVKGKTAYPIFDAYVRQSYLDNLLRGGYPVLFEGKSEPIVYHVYSRIHGDMEREYNDFYVEPAFYSHGNGNYRDVNQNRRNDVFFVKEAGLFNIRQFMNLLQLDGQNPLVIKGSFFTIDIEGIQDILAYAITKHGLLSDLLSKNFTPGALMRTVVDHQIDLTLTADEFVKIVLSKSEQHFDAAYGHGFWVDHWTYNMDLIDNYLNVYPDRFEGLLFEEQFSYFQSPDTVLPRIDKYVLTRDGKVRQYDAIIRDTTRMEKLKLDPNKPSWHKTHDGEIYQSSLACKLIVLVANKMTNFDPSGIGIMMNSDKPGWNDAMNGLPGLFGSGLSEVVELRRIIKLLIRGIKVYKRSCELPTQVAELLSGYDELLKSYNAKVLSELEFWERVQDLKEMYLKAVEYDLSSQRVSISSSSLLDMLVRFDLKLQQSIEKGIEIGEGLLISYLVHEAVDYHLLDGKTHPVNGLQNVAVTKWAYRPLPRYLEGPARYLKSVYNPSDAKKMYDVIINSGMYDQKLKMYITSETLEQESLEIGRARAFSAGWLERESNFMHMSYKYLLGILKAGLYDEFFKDIQTSMPPFMDPSVYGRSSLENSSFIASSRNPNPENHGRGFVSRLTGTTSEMISIWIHMMFGTKVFSYNHNLCFRLQPVLPSDFFDEKGEVHAMLFGSTAVIYQNPMRKNTYGEDGVRATTYELIYKNGHKELYNDEVTGAAALAIRNSEVAVINVKFSA